MRHPIFLLVGLLVATALHAQTEASRIKNFNVKNSLALEGYDPVSYYTGRPVKGKAEFSFVYKKITYRFGSQANLDKFKASPGKYEPAYGGWCAYAMGETGEKVKVDPETFKILDGRLLLFYNFRGNDTLNDWNKNEKGLKVKADQNWKKIVQ
ncbi:MAG TPA: YHS domain-containing (seleno)protein [Cyclobacteriaceae bacterium]|nr:YHS domain protein [Cyclobacteriaceae bacterium]MCB9237713.1 YHS domain protein [Flammeovirgaceae bacterium]MCB0498773.1 YHS domain protein [Cyclobacteriaceae bacterium]MCO5270185.1 YHS domain protein [Cyclobacteriaceae bacterium]MCW5903764.1 YHS domain protein [Cyclobacteriaceae bacterium]